LWAGANSWTNVGPEGGSARFLVADPQNPAVIYAVTGVGLFKSNDGGENWANAGLIGWTVRTLVIDPQNPTTLYAFTDGHPDDDSEVRKQFRSNDGGTSWSEQSCCCVAAVDPKNSSTLYALAGDPFRGLFKSIDAGANWRLTRGLPGPELYFVE